MVTVLSVVVVAAPAADSNVVAVLFQVQLTVLSAAAPPAPGLSPLLSFVLVDLAVLAAADAVGAASLSLCPHCRKMPASSALLAAFSAVHGG